MAIPKSWAQLHHIANVAMTGIHDVLPTDKDDDEDTISPKKILKMEGTGAFIKNVLGFEFDGNPGEHTIWLTEDRHTYIWEKKWKIELGKESIKKHI